MLVMMMIMINIIIIITRSTLSIMTTAGDKDTDANMKLCYYCDSDNRDNNEKG